MSSGCISPKFDYSLITFCKFPCSINLNRICVISFCRFIWVLTLTFFPGGELSLTRSSSLALSLPSWLRRRNSSRYFLERTGTPVVILVSMMMLLGSSHASSWFICWTIFYLDCLSSFNFS